MLGTLPERMILPRAADPSLYPRDTEAEHLNIHEQMQHIGVKPKRREEAEGLVGPALLPKSAHPALGLHCTHRSASRVAGVGVGNRDTWESAGCHFRDVEHARPKARAESNENLAGRSNQGVSAPRSDGKASQLPRVKEAIAKDHDED